MESIHNAILRSQPIDWVLSLLFLFLLIIQIIFLLRVYLRVAYLNRIPADKPETLSLLLTIRNEENALKENLPAVLSNNSGNFEVVAVDNCSQDHSLSVLTAYANENAHLRLSSLKQQVQYSDKMAQNIAMKAAKFDWVNVIPPSVKLPGENWLREISSRLNSGSQAVVFYSNIAPSGRFYNLLYRTEFFFQQIKSFGFILNGLPFVVSQDNVAFRKQQYFDNGRYRGIISEPFAKLELVINSFIRKIKVSVDISDETAIQRKEDITWKDYLELLKKEENVKKFLPAGIRLLLFLIEWSFLLLAPVAGILIYRMPSCWPVVVLLILGLLAINVLIIKKLLARLKEYKLFLPSFLLALMLPFFKLFFRLVFIRYGLKKEWKIES